ncbi:MAG: hypothetical protein J0G94_03585 [Sphingomonadales bacterium]|nr:hypothetical protein [Sphingomonadales bacterium]
MTKGRIEVDPPTAVQVDVAKEKWASEHLAGSQLAQIREAAHRSNQLSKVLVMFYKGNPPTRRIETDKERHRAAGFAA